MIVKHAAALLVCGMGLFGLVGRAAAESPEEWRETENQAPEQKMTLRQHYTGVKPGEGNQLPRVEELKNKGGVWVTWPGFMLLENGGTRLFLQATENLSYQIKDSGKQVVLIFKNAKVHLSNNRNPLVTTHFNTPLKRAYLKKKKKSIELVLELKVAVTPEISQLTDADGYRYLFVDFAPGNYPVVEYSGNPSFSGVGTPQPDAYGDTPQDALPAEADNP